MRLFCRSFGSPLGEGRSYGERDNEMSIEGWAVSAALKRRLAVGCGKPEDGRKRWARRRFLRTAPVTPDAVKRAAGVPPPGLALRPRVRAGFSTSDKG